MATGSVFLCSPRLRLRDVRIEDRDDLLNFWRRPDYLRHSLIDPPTPTSVATRIQRAVEEQGQDPRPSYFLVALEKTSGKLIGEGFLSVRHTEWRVAEIGWGVHGDFVGRALATEIGQALIQFGFDRLGMHRIQATCRVENAASRRIMTKLGMMEEGIFRVSVVARGERWSSVHAAILATDGH